MNKLTIRWLTKDTGAIEAIRKRFGMTCYTTINGLSPVEIKTEDMEDFNECVRRKFFSIMPVEWCKNGAHYSFISH